MWPQPSPFSEREGYKVFLEMPSYEKTPMQDFELTLEPLKAEVLGKFGLHIWQLFPQNQNAKHARYYFPGNYVFIWKNQPDGAWQYVLDTENPTPAQQSFHSSITQL